MKGEFVFCCFKDAEYGDHKNLNPVASIQEKEGLTLVIPRETADAFHYQYESTFAGITLNIHSSLDAIGLTAAFSSKLAEVGLSANVIAGFFHDHMFVPYAEVDRALAALLELGSGSCET